MRFPLKLATNNSALAVAANSRTLVSNVMAPFTTDLLSPNRRLRASLTHPLRCDEVITMRRLSRFGQVEEHDARRIAHRRVMAREGESTRGPIDAEHRHVVRSLIAAIEELPRGIEIKAARIVSTCPFLAGEA